MPRLVLRLFWNTKEHWRFHASTHILAHLGEMGEGTHTVIMEENRMQLFQAVQQFPDERLKPNQ